MLTKKINIDIQVNPFNTYWVTGGQGVVDFHYTETQTNACEKSKSSNHLCFLNIHVKTIWVGTQIKQYYYK